MAAESSVLIPRAFLSSWSTTAQGAAALPQLLCWPFFKYLSLHRQPPFCTECATGEVQVKMHKPWWSPWWWWFTRDCLQWKEGWNTMSFIQLFLPKDFWKLITSRLKKEKKNVILQCWCEALLHQSQLENMGDRLDEEAVTCLLM